MNETKVILGACIVGVCIIVSPLVSLRGPIKEVESAVRAIAAEPKTVNYNNYYTITNNPNSVFNFYGDKVTRENKPAAETTPQKSKPTPAHSTPSQTEAVPAPTLAKATTAPAPVVAKVTPILESTVKTASPESHVLKFPDDVLRESGNASYIGYKGPGMFNAHKVITLNPGSTVTIENNAKSSWTTSIDPSYNIYPKNIRMVIGKDGKKFEQDLSVSKLLPEGWDSIILTTKNGEPATIRFQVQVPMVASRK